MISDSADNLHQATSSEFWVRLVVLKLPNKQLSEVLQFFPRFGKVLVN